MLGSYKRFNVELVAQRRVEYGEFVVDFVTAVAVYYDFGFYRGFGLVYFRRVIIVLLGLIV